MSSNAAVAPKPKQYRRFLTSALHTRFVQAAFATLAWHSVLSIAAGQRPSTPLGLLWLFNPLSLRGIQALCFSLTSLIIFVLQIATLQIGHRCTPSNWTSLKTTLLSVNTYQILVAYIFAAAWFCEVYIWSSPAKNEMSLVVNGGYGAPDRLNERPIYLRCFFFLVGFGQACSHICRGNSSLSIKIKHAKCQAINEHTEPENKTQSTLTDFNKQWAQMTVQRAALISGIATLLGPVFYRLLRSFLWPIHLSLATAVFTLPRSEATPPKGFYVGTVVGRAFIFGTILSITWQLNIALFQAYMTLPPTKQGQPLSALSKDPNGTLLSGLVAKRELVQTFAFWELDIISRSDKVRRQAIFSDFERVNSRPMFELMVSASHKVLQKIDERIKQADPPPEQPTTTPRGAPIPNGVQNLPRLLPNGRPARIPIFPPPESADFLRNRSTDQPFDPTPYIERPKQLAIEASKPIIEKASPYKAQAAAYIADNMSPIGRLVNKLPVRVVKSAILGTPTANPALTLNAISSITRLLKASLDEDTYGKAASSVPPTIIQYMNSLFVIEAFVRKHIPEKVTAGQAMDLEEVMQIHQELKKSLNELLEKFHAFLSDVGLSIKDFNDAKKVAREQTLFTVEEPTASVPAPTREGFQQRLEMEEVVQERQRHGTARVKRPENENRRESTEQRRPSNAQERRASEADQQRPGRLFKQLDQGSAYQNSLRHRRDVAARAEAEKLYNVDKNPNDWSGNVFAPNDLNPLGGGLQRRRTGKVGT